MERIYVPLWTSCRNLEFRAENFNFLPFFFLIEISCLAVLGKIWKVRLYVRPEAQQFLSALKPIR